VKNGMQVETADFERCNVRIVKRRRTSGLGERRTLIYQHGLNMLWGAGLCIEKPTKNLGFGKDAVHCTPFCTAATTEADLRHCSGQVTKPRHAEHHKNPNGRPYLTAKQKLSLPVGLTK